MPIAFFLSGAAALIYESLWMRQFGLIFGNTTYSVTLILATYMGGLALGSYLVTRLSLSRPLLAYALAELGVGLTALLTLLLLRRLPEWYGWLLQAGALPAPLPALLRPLSAALIIAPTTLLLGTTFPLLTEYLTRRRGRLQASLATLYWINTLGAASGVLLTTFALLPVLGVTRTFLAAAAVNLLIGVSLALAGRREPEVPEAERPTPPPAAEAGRTAPQPAGRLWSFAVLAFLSGLSSFGLEILWTRSLALVVGSSFYSFNAMLVAFLLGIVLGSVIYGRVWPRMRSPALWLGLFFALAGALVLLDVAAIGSLPRLLYDAMVGARVSFVNFQALGFALSLLSMLPVTTVFGLTFPLLTRLLRESETSARRVSGLLYAWNTLGSILGALATGFLLIRWLGIQASFALLAALLLLPGAWLLLAGLPRLSRGARWAACGGLAALLALLGVFYRPWDPLLMTAGVYKYGLQFRAVIPSGRQLQDSLRRYRTMAFYREGLEATVSVTRTQSNTFLSLNGKIDAGNHVDVITQKLLAHVPLVLHPDPREVFIIGWGSGSTAGSAAMHPVTSIRCAEIEPEVFRTAGFFEDINFGVHRDPRFSLVLQDARNLLLTDPRTYDVIISEPSNPWVSGMSSLFTSDFYRIALARLREDGVFCQWFHYYDLTLEDVRLQIRTFGAHFPFVSLWLVPPRLSADGRSATPVGDLLLIGSRRPLPLDYGRVSRALASPAVRSDLAGVGVDGGLALLCSCAADQEDLRRLAGGARFNTDDTPYIELSAPKGLYAATEDVAREQFAIYDRLAGAGRELLPPIVNHPALEAGAPAARRAALYEELAAVYRQKLQFARAERLLAEAERLAEAFPRP